MQRKRTYAPSTVAKRSKSAAAKIKTQPNRKKVGRNFNVVTFVPSLGPLGFPQRLRANLRYEALVTLSFVSSQTAHHVFSCNGLYDPDVTGIGTQPYYFDQLMAIYDHYTVMGSKITATLQGYTSSSSYPLTFMIGVNDDATIQDNLLREQAGTNSAAVNLNSEPKVLNNTWSARATFGPGTTSDPNMRGSASANPTESSTFAVAIKSPTVDTVTAYLRVVVDYNAIFSELKDAAAS